MNAAIAAAIALIRLFSLLIEARQDAELRQILRSYLRWMPLCLFSEPVLWLRMLLASHRRFQRRYQRPYSFYAPHLSAGSFRAPDRISRFLEANVAAIRDEFARIAPPDEVITPSKELVAKGKWNTFPLMRATKRFEENIAKCPKTWAAVAQLPLLWEMRGRGNVYFSIMYPGTEVRAHCGPSNLKLRYHLTIEEAEGIRIRSGAEWRTWRRGECLILDDSIEHEVAHAGDNKRVVLIVDCWHPDLNEKERAFLRRLHGVLRDSA